MWERASTRLEGRAVILEPLDRRHEDGLRAAAAASETWRWMSERPPADPKGFGTWFSGVLERRRARVEIPFATLSKEGETLGSTRYLNLRPEHRSLEIGWTWLRPEAWGTGVNVESKLLLLGHAFEQLGCVRVEFKTDALNERSRAALAALPARFEGIHRKHMLVRGGERRDSAWYSVIDDEWDEVRAILERRLAAARSRRHGEEPAPPSPRVQTEER